MSHWSNDDAALTDRFTSMSNDELKAYFTAFKTLLLIDDCSYMADDWATAKEAARTLADKTFEFKSNGFELAFCSSHGQKQNVREVRSPQAISSAMDRVAPRGIAMVIQRLKETIQGHLTSLLLALRDSEVAFLEIKPLNVLVITNGEFCAPNKSKWDHHEKIKAEIEPIIKRLKYIKTPDDIERHIGIQFVRVGKSLDGTTVLQAVDDMFAQSEDIVDTTAWSRHLSERELYKVLLGAVSKAVDEGKSEHVEDDEDEENQPDSGYNSEAAKATKPTFPHVPAKGGKGTAQPDAVIGSFPYPGTLGANEMAILIPPNYGAAVTAMAKATYLQRIDLDMRALDAKPQDVALVSHYMEGSGVGVELTDPQSSGKAAKTLKFNSAGWLVVKSTHARPKADHGTEYFKSAIKLMSNEKEGNITYYVLGTEDGGTPGKPNKDFTDTSVSIVVSPL